MPVQTAIQPAFRDAVRELQAVFRLAMRTWLARPDRAARYSPAPPAPLFAPAAALLLTLCDYETPVWLDPVLADSAEVAAFLRFHTGARLVASPADAAFAVIADAARMPALSAFRAGQPTIPTERPR